MIIGSGLLASEFAKKYAERSDIIIFASGVSNSNEVNNEEFAREKNLLQRYMIKSTGKFVYFSTCSIYDPEMKTKPYVLHKMEMERLIINKSPSCTIFRLPQVVGKNRNKNTLTNYLYDRISANEEFKVWRDAHRYLIDVCDVEEIVNGILIRGQDKEKIINIAPPTSISVLNIIKIIEKILIKKANYCLVDGGGVYNIDAIQANKVAVLQKINFDNNYPDRILRKYYGK